MTRVQKERFFNEEDYVRMKDFYILDKTENGTWLPSDMLVLHPLPRVNEIAVEVDDDPESCLFQAGSICCLCTYGSDSDTSGGKKYVKCRSVKSEGVVLDHIEAGKEHGHLSLSETGSAGLLCCHHQKCPQRQNGQKRYHQSRMSD